MNNICIFILIIILVLFRYIDTINIYISDIIYEFKLKSVYRKKINENLTIENINKINNNNIKILIVSFDNRKNLNYLEDHNNNIKAYCEKYKNIEYEFNNFTTKNVYWYKIYLVLEKLLTNNYDYVMWMDTDSIIINKNLDIRNILILFNSDIFISYDNHYKNCENVLNAGVFIIKNSENGINFLKDVLYNFENSKCLNEDNSLNGMYSYLCYEQGAMNNLIYDKYYKYTTILSNNIILNSHHCNEKTFILHNYGGKTVNTDIKSCFNKHL
jgi:hypothetical protein